jgi:hypothetical protein
VVVAQIGNHATARTDAQGLFTITGLARIIHEAQERESGETEK